MLLNSYIAAAVLAFCAAQTNAAPVPPPEFLDLNNIQYPARNFLTFDFNEEKRSAEPQWWSANRDGSVPASFMQAVNKWQSAKSGGGNKYWKGNEKRDAEAIPDWWGSANKDGSVPLSFMHAVNSWQKSKHSGKKWEQQQRRDAGLVLAKPDGLLSPQFQAALDRWNQMFGGNEEEKRDADAQPVMRGFPWTRKPSERGFRTSELLDSELLDSELLDKRSPHKDDDKDAKTPVGPGVFDKETGDYRALMIQRDAEAQYSGGLFNKDWMDWVKAQASARRQPSKREAQQSEASIRQNWELLKRLVGQYNQKRDATPFKAHLSVPGSHGLIGYWGSEEEK